MSAKQKTTSSKENWQAIRRRYTWHLRPPFKDKFDHSHWWKEKDLTKIEPAAALYELARRHPFVGEGLHKRMPSPAERAAIYANVWGDPTTCPPAVVESRLSVLIEKAVAELHEPRSLHWTCKVGLKSWAKLGYTDRSNWKSCVGALKGLDLRREESQCRSINQLAHWRIVDERKAALTKRGQIKDYTYEETDEEWDAATGKNLSVLHNDLAVNPPTAGEWEAAIGYQAVEAHRQGCLLLAVVPDLPTDKAASLMEKVYGNIRRKFAKSKQRARRENWLPLIESFEGVGTSHKAYAQDFARYRRALDGICFDATPPPSVTITPPKLKA